MEKINWDNPTWKYNENLKIYIRKYGNPNISLNNKNFTVNLSMKINNNINLPSDSVVSIVSNGIFGSKYISINPGFDENMISKDDTGSLFMTRSSINIEDLISSFDFKVRNQVMNVLSHLASERAIRIEGKNVFLSE